MTMIIDKKYDMIIDNIFALVLILYYLWSLDARTSDNIFDKICLLF